MRLQSGVRCRSEPLFSTSDTPRMLACSASIKVDLPIIRAAPAHNRMVAAFRAGGGRANHTCDDFSRHAVHSLRDYCGCYYFFLSGHVVSTVIFSVSTILARNTPRLNTCSYSLFAETSRDSINFAKDSPLMRKAALVLFPDTLMQIALKCPAWSRL